MKCQNLMEDSINSNGNPTVMESMKPGTEEGLNPDTDIKQARKPERQIHGAI